MESIMKIKNNALMLLLMVFIMNEGERVEAQVHHVVGDDRGWDLGSDIAAWAADRTFTVGDFLWFAYSGGIAKDKVVELQSKEEFEACDVRNPIKMYTDGMDKISLEEEGFRYFASSNLDSCIQGLKLPVEVKSSKSTAKNGSMRNVGYLAPEPSSPSSSTKICGPIIMIFGALLFIHVVL